MTVKVKGMSYRPVQLPELRDAVFYGQVKTYTDVQRSVCPSMAAAISNGSLALVDESAEHGPVFRPLVDTLQNLTTPSMPAPSITVAEVTETKVLQADPVNLDALADKVVAAMTAKMAESKPQEVLAPSPTEQESKTVDAIEKLAKKLDVLVISGPGISQNQTRVLSKDEHAAAVSDTYIPDIRVDDMSNNVKLEARSLGQGGQVNSALAALRKLQQPKT